jgi:hypothetical protein
MSYDYQIDLETLSVEKNAIILSIGAVRFDPNEYMSDTPVAESIFYGVVDFEFSDGHLDKDTLTWLFQQPKETQDAIFGKDIEKHNLRTQLLHLRDFIQDGFDTRSSIWANSPDFDLDILEHHFKKFDIDIPWGFWQRKDVRTIKSYLTELPPRIGRHNALEDALWQTHVVQIFNYLWGGKQ